MVVRELARSVLLHRPLDELVGVGLRKINPGCIDRRIEPDHVLEYGFGAIALEEIGFAGVLPRVQHGHFNRDSLQCQRLRKRARFRGDSRFPAMLLVACAGEKARSLTGA
jgi:hypothetical protein